MTALVWVGVIFASWAVLGCLNAAGWAWAVGRLKRRWAARQHYTVLVLDLPPVPESDATWLDAWEAANPVIREQMDADVIEQAVWDEQFLAIPEVAADLRRAS